MKHINGGITAAKGFEAAGVSAEIKYKNSDIPMNKILEKNLKSLNELDEKISK